MTIVELRTYLVDNTVFQKTEIVPRADAILNKTLRLFNKYLPRIIRSETLLGAPYRILQTPIDAYTIDPNRETVGTYTYAIDWDLNTIDTSNYYHLFLEALEAHTFMMLSNSRRSVTLEGAPFDLKGDTYHEEGRTMLQEVEQKMYTSQNAYV